MARTEPVPMIGRTLPSALLTAHEAAAYVGVHANTIYNAAKSGDLRYRAIGRLRRFTVADLDDWTQGRR
jgi:excisionase family DNA binding protein